VKERAEIQEETRTKVNKINADTNVLYEEKMAEATLIETKILAEARKKAAKIRAEADAYSITTVSEAQQ
jgi:hypothetical protein